MEQRAQRQAEGHPAQQQAEDHPAQQQAEDNSPRAALKKEVEEYLSQMARTFGFFDVFRNDMQAAVNELSQYDVRRYLYVTQTCDDIEDCMRTAKQQSEIFINREQYHPGRTRKHIQKMLEQLCVFRQHRNRITDLYLRGTMCKNPEPRELEWDLVKHMTLLREDVQLLIDMANGAAEIDDDQAAGDTSRPPQLESHQD